MINKILYITTSGGTMCFFKTFIKHLIHQGYSLEIATNETIHNVPDFYRELNCKIHQISCSRSPLDAGNIKAIKQINKIVKKGNYDIVHCHTPIASMCTRLACKSLRKTGLKVIYTAHGFHFFKGAPLKNWLLYYPIEKWLSRYTDVLITINKEDYALAKRKMKAKKIEYIPGVGVDLDKFNLKNFDRKAYREKLGLNNDDFMILSVGELSNRKNHSLVIKSVAKINNPKIHYFIAGIGANHDKYKELASTLGISNQVHLLGHRNDIAELCNTADLYVFPSYQEGLPVSLMEAMASGLPIICSDIRGNRDLIEHDKGGYLCSPKDSDAFCEAIQKLYKNADKRANMSKINKENICRFGVNDIIGKMEQFYNIN